MGVPNGMVMLAFILRIGCAQYLDWHCDFIWTDCDLIQSTNDHAEWGFNFGNGYAYFRSNSPGEFAAVTVPYQSVSARGTMYFGWENRFRPAGTLNITACRHGATIFSVHNTVSSYRSQFLSFACSSAEDVEISFIAVAGLENTAIRLFDIDISPVPDWICTFEHDECGMVFTENSSLTWIRDDHAGDVFVNPENASEQDRAVMAIPYNFTSSRGNLAFMVYPAYVPVVHNDSLRIQPCKSNGSIEMIQKVQKFDHWLYDYYALHLVVSYICDSPEDVAIAFIIRGGSYSFIAIDDIEIFEEPWNGYPSTPSVDYTTASYFPMRTEHHTRRQTTKPFEFHTSPSVGRPTEGRLTKRTREPVSTRFTQALSEFFTSSAVQTDKAYTIPSTRSVTSLKATREQHRSSTTTKKTSVAATFHSTKSSTETPMTGHLLTVRTRSTRLTKNTGAPVSVDFTRALFGSLTSATTETRGYFTGASTSGETNSEGHRESSTFIIPVATSVSLLVLIGAATSLLVVLFCRKRDKSRKAKEVTDGDGDDILYENPAYCTKDNVSAKPDLLIGATAELRSQFEKHDLDNEYLILADTKNPSSEDHTYYYTTPIVAEITGSTQTESPASGKGHVYIRPFPASKDPTAVSVEDKHNYQCLHGVNGEVVPGLEEPQDLYHILEDPALKNREISDGYECLHTDGDILLAPTESSYHTGQDEDEANKDMNNEYERLRRVEENHDPASVDGEHHSYYYPTAMERENGTNGDMDPIRVGPEYQSYQDHTSRDRKDINDYKDLHGTDGEIDPAHVGPKYHNYQDPTAQDRKAINNYQYLQGTDGQIDPANVGPEYHSYQDPTSMTRKNSNNYQSLKRQNEDNNHARVDSEYHTYQDPTAMERDNSREYQGIHRADRNIDPAPVDSEYHSYLDLTQEFTDDRSDIPAHPEAFYDDEYSLLHSGKELGDYHIYQEGN